MKIVPEGEIENKSSLVQVVVWPLIDVKLLFEPMLAYIPIYVYIHICMNTYIHVFYMRSLWQSIKMKPTNMYIASARVQFKINTHGCWNGHLCIPDRVSVVQCSLGHVIFLHNFSGIKWTCWTTGSWRCCLSLKVVSSIPTGSTIIYQLLCEFICLSLYQSIKIKPRYMYMHNLLSLNDCRAQYI